MDEEIFIDDVSGTAAELKTNAVSARPGDNLLTISGGVNGVSVIDDWEIYAPLASRGSSREYGADCPDHEPDMWPNHRSDYFRSEQFFGFDILIITCRLCRCRTFSVFLSQF